MTIEFNCPQCGQLLTTSDDKAGLQAKCPGCRMPFVVPERTPDVFEALGEDEFVEGYDQPADEVAHPQAGLPAPNVPTSGSMKSCPACEELVPQRSRVCQYCGERFGPPARRTVDVGEIISDSWKIYSENFGLCFGGFILESFLTMVVFGVGAVLAIVLVAVLSAALPQESAVLIAAVVVVPVSLYVSAHMQAGQHLFHLSLARGENADLGQLAGGGPYAWRLVATSLVFGILYLLGFIMCIIPGFLVLLMYWPFGFALVDTDAPGLQALRRAREVTQQNWTATFLIWLVSVGIQMAGAMVFYIGVLFTTPFVALMLAVAYQHMSEVDAGRQLAPE